METSTIDQVEYLSKELDNLKPLKKEYQQKLDKKIRLEFNYNSNHIEGNTLTYGETELLLIFDKTTGNHELREYEEMKSHDVAFDLIQEWAKDKNTPLTEMAIKNLHEVLLVRPFWKDAITPDGQDTRRLIKVGSYKEQPNSVRLQNGNIFHYTSPEDTPIEMGELILWYRNEEETGEIHPIELAALLHYKFVRIHPFDDGNGRISRLLMNYVLLRNNYPPVIVKTAEKNDYLFALNQADTGDILAFIDYVAKQLIWSLNINIKAAKGESLDEPGDLEKKIYYLKKKIGVSDSTTTKYSLEILMAIVKDTIMPIAEEWENKLQQIEELFFTRQSTVEIFNQKRRGENLFYTFKDAYDELILQNSNYPEEEKYDILLSCNFKRLRNSNIDQSFYGGEIRFIFHKNLYEIDFTGASKNIEKLYLDGLSGIEKDQIISTIGNHFIEIVEKAIEDEKLDLPF